MAQSCRGSGYKSGVKRRRSTVRVFCLRWDFLNRLEVTARVFNQFLNFEMRHGIKLINSLVTHGMI
jgi:hypothetical protein